MSGYTTQTLQFGAATIIIHRPELSDAERRKREQQIEVALGHAMRDCLKRKQAS